MSPCPFEIAEPVGTMRCAPSDDEGPLVHVTAIDPLLALLRPTNPIWLATGTPLDGLFLTMGYTLSLAVLESHDLSLRPIRWSAGEWPGQV
jgi:hypothetical protein